MNMAMARNELARQTSPCEQLATTMRTEINAGSPSRVITELTGFLACAPARQREVTEIRSRTTVRLIESRGKCELILGTGSSNHGQRVLLHHHLASHRLITPLTRVVMVHFLLIPRPRQLVQKPPP